MGEVWMLGYTLLNEWTNARTYKWTNQSRNNQSEYEGGTVDFLNKSRLSQFWDIGGYSTKPHWPSHLTIYHIQLSPNEFLEVRKARLPFGMAGSVHKRAGETDFCPTKHMPNDFSSIQIYLSQNNFSTGSLFIAHINIFYPQYALTFWSPLHAFSHSILLILWNRQG